MKAHVSLAFAKMRVRHLPDFTTGVFDGMTKNAGIFDKPPVTMAALDAANQTLISAVAAAVRGSEAQTDARDIAAVVVIGLLRLLAAYVADVAKGDETIIALSGFKAVQRGPRPQQPLVKTIIKAIRNEMSGQLLLRLNSQDNAYGYEGQMSADGGTTWQSIGFFQQARRVVVPNLTPGVTYTFKFRALGGSTNAGDWSDPVSHMAT